MKINRKIKNILTITAGVGATTLMVIPAVTLASCSSASNSFYPTTSISFGNGVKQVLGVDIPNNFEINNGTNQISWDGTFYGFNSINEITKMYSNTLAENGLNIYQPSSAAVEAYNKNGNRNWYKDVNANKLPTSFSMVNRLPFAALNALNVYQFSQVSAMTYAKFIQKSLVNLGVQNFNKNNAFSLTNLFASNPNINDIKQLLYGLNIGIGQAGNSYFLGMSNLEMNIASSDNFSLDPNISTSLTNPGNPVGQSNGIGYIRKVEGSNPVKYEINQEKLMNDTIKYVTVTPSITYTWYKQLQTGGAPVKNLDDLNAMKNAMVSKDSVYSDLGELKTNYTISLQPITFAIRQDVIFTNLSLSSDGTPIFDEACVNTAKAITTGAITPISFTVGESKSPVQVSFCLGNKPATTLDFGVNAASTQILINAINNIKLNGEDDHQEWTTNLYKLPFFAYSKYNELISSSNQTWNKATIKSSAKFSENFNNVATWFKTQIGDNEKNWINLTTIPSNGNIQSLITKFEAK